MATQCGKASWYHEGKLTATGERYRPDGITAAHRTLPFGTIVQVRHQRTGRTVTVRINDRGPFIRGRIIDLSRGAKRHLGMDGIAPVCIRVVGRNKSHSRIARADRFTLSVGKQHASHAPSAGQQHASPALSVGKQPASPAPSAGKRPASHASNAEKRSVSPA
ncbi:MAG: septal ring lytic transglycosylase RlpA family protein [Alphaproteobacteria bacterium]